MASLFNKLTATKVASLNLRGMHLDGGGLYLQVSKYGTRNWIFRFKSPTTGKTRDMGLGSVQDVTLARAREKARQARALVAESIDPIGARRGMRVEARLAAARSKTFRECAEAYIAAHGAGWRNDKHRYQWRQTMTAYAAPKIGDMPVADIQTADVVRVLEPIWREKPETASRVRQRIERILSWATTQGFREGDNPARWRGHLDNLLPGKTAVRPVQRYPALPYTEIAAFLSDLRERTATAARALEFTILTATRSGDALGARWSEIDLTGKIWTVPADRMKGGREHRVPLSGRVIAILEPLHELRGEFVFPGHGEAERLSDMALLMLRRMGRKDITVHGFRSTFRDWAAEQTNFPNHVAEMALAHTIGSDVEAAYGRGDLLAKRRKLMEAWADYSAAVRGGKIVAMVRQ